MKQDAAMDVVAEKIKNCEDIKEAAKALIASHKKHIEDAERDLSRANNVQDCLEEAMIHLQDARDKDAGTDSGPPYRSSLDSPRPLEDALQVLEKKKHPYLKNRKEEPSAMEKIADDIEKENKEDLPEDEILARNKEALEKTEETPTAEKTIRRGEKAIKAAELEQRRSKDWAKCPVCKVRPMAPWNKTGKCATCSHPKGKRPYKRRAKKEKKLPF